MFALESARSEQWYSITWTDVNGNTGTVERPAGEAAWYVSSLLETTGNTLTSMVRVD